MGTGACESERLSRQRIAWQQTASPDTHFANGQAGMAVAQPAMERVLDSRMEAARITKIKS